MSLEASQKKIKVKAMCLFVHNGRVLVADGDSLKSSKRDIVPSHFYRVLGGSINFNETAEQGVKREIKEELGSDINNLEKVDVVENQFIYAGQEDHEIVFLFKGTLAQNELTKQDVIHVIDEDYEFDAVWVSIEELLSGDKPLYPMADYRKLLDSVH